MKMLRDVFTVFWLKIKLYLRDGWTILILAVSCVCFLFCMTDLNQSAKEQSTLGIGVINLDEEVAGEELIARLKDVPALSVHTGDLAELKTSMLEGEISCIFEIPKDYTEKLRQGRYRNLITVYQAADGSVSAVLTDIVAGEMMYELCLARAYQTYEKLPEYEKEKYSRQEYAEMTASLMDREEFDFAFQFEYVAAGGSTYEEGVDNSLFYRQAVAAAALMLMTLLPFAAMSGRVIEREQGILARRKLLVMRKGAQLIGEWLAAAVLSFLLPFLFAVTVSLGVNEAKVFLPLLWISVLFSVMMALFYYILTVLTKKLIVYQAVGAAVLVLTGAGGFCSLVEGVLIRSFPAWFDWIPNCAYLRAFTRLIGRL